MKKNLFLLLLFFVGLSCKAQDKVVFHNGKTVEGKVKEVADKYIKFYYKGEDALNIIGKNSISEIQYGSGRVEQSTEKINVDTITDWPKVKVVYDKEEVMGLKSLGQIEKHSSGTWSFSLTAGHFNEKTLKKIRKEAAKRGGCFVLVLSSQSKSGGLFSDGHASMTGEVYTY